MWGSAFAAFLLAAAWPILGAAPAQGATAAPTVFTLEIVARTRNVTDVVQATDGTLWFISDGRVCGYDGSSAPSCLAGPTRPRRLLASPDGGVFVASEQPTFLSLLDSASTTAVEFNPALKGVRITDLCWWNGMPWAATGSRLLPLLGEDARTHAIEVGGEDIVAVAAKPTGPLYIASEHRLFRLDSPDATAAPVRSDDVEGHAVSALALDGKGDVWVGTTRGLWHNGHIVPQNLQIEAALSSRALDAVLVDAEGSVWVAATPGLVQLRANPAIRVFAAADGLGGEIPFSVHASADDDVWLAQNQGVSHWNGRKFINFGVEAGFKFLDLRTLSPNPAGGFWVGGLATGLWHLEHGKARHADPDLPPTLRPGVRTLMTDSAGALWIGFEKGGLATRDRGGSITQIPLAANGAPPLVGPLVEHEAAIWVGFRDGGFGRVVNNVFERLSGPALNALSATPVFAFAFESNSDVVWLATHGQGLWRYSHGELRAIKAADGLPSNNISSLARDQEGRIWAGTDTGVFVVSMADANAWLDGRLAKLSIAAFDQRDGMRSVEAVREFAPPVAMTATGKLWQPTPNGVVVFDTASLPPRPTPPNVFVSNLSINGKPVPPETISMPVGAGELDARLLAPTFLYPHRLTVQYRVRPLDGDGEKPWIDAQDDHRILARNLKPGAYVLQAQAFYPDNPSDKASASRLFTLKARFYMTLPFYFALAFLAALAFALLHRRRNLMMRQRFELVLDERRRISRDMHDSLQQDLVGLKFHIETALITGGIAEPARLHLEKAAELAAVGVRDLRDAVDGLTAAALSVAALEQHISQQMQRLFEGSPTATSIRRSGPEANLSVYVATALWQITREALTNVHKHAQATQLDVLLAADAGRLKLTIADNGLGADPRTPKQTGRGIANMRHRAKEAGIQLDFDTALGHGYKLTLNAPTIRKAL